MGTRYQVKQGTAAELAAINPTLLSGEQSLETDTRVEKIGDGVTPYNSLPIRQSGAFAQAVRRLGAGSVHALARVDITKMRALNAAASLTIPTFDGGNELTHSAIVFDPDGWNGWKFWMVGTPYAAANNQIENPSVYVANDPTTVGGTNGWQVPSGLTNPIDPTPINGGYNSDPDLEWGPDGTLYCFWRSVAGSETPNSAKERIRMRSTTDGVTWSSPVTLITNDITVSRPAAPSVIWDGTRWLMWAVDIIPDPNRVVRYTCTASDPTAPGNWSAPVNCTMATPMPAAREVWHIDVNKYGDQYHVLINDSDRGQSGSQGNLYCGYSNDGGLTWTVADTPVIPRNSAGFDATFYRSSMVPASLGGSDGYFILYSGISSGGAYKFGATFAPFRRELTPERNLHRIIDGRHLEILAARIPLDPYVIGDTFNRANASLPGAADSGQAWAVESGVPGIIDGQAYATTAVGTKWFINSDQQDAELTCTIGGTVAGAYLLFRRLDDTNFLRVGAVAPGPKYRIDQVVAGTLTNLFTGTTTAVAGDEVRVYYKGSYIALYVNEVLQCWVNAPVLLTATGVGMQTAVTTTRFDNFRCRKLVNDY